MAPGSAKLSWRLDPVETFSDWTIVITPVGDPVLPITSDHDNNHEPETKKPRLASNSSTTYNVHRNVLAVGDRKSQYFESQFKEGNEFAESSTRTSDIDQDPTTAAAFPAMLNFMYNEDKVITSENAIPLLHLADYFVIQALSEAVNRFVEHDLKPRSREPSHSRNLDEEYYYLSDSDADSYDIHLEERKRVLSASISYFKQATAYRTIGETLKPILSKAISEGFCSIDEQSVLKIPIELFKAVATSTKLRANQKVATLFVAYLKNGTEVVDDETFRLVTNEETMPVVIPEVSFDLLKESSERSRKPSEISFAEEYASLQDRCIKSASTACDVLSKEIEKSNTVDAEVQPTAYQQIQLNEKVQLLESALRVSTEQNSALCDAEAKANKYLEELKSFVRVKREVRVYKDNKYDEGVLYPSTAQEDEDLDGKFIRDDECQCDFPVFAYKG